MTNLG